MCQREIHNEGYGETSNRKQTELALQESEERYRRLIEYAPTAICLHQDGLFVYANRAAVELLGATSSKDLVGQSVLGVFHPDYHDVVKQRIQSLLEGNTTFNGSMEQKMIRLDKSVIEVALTGIQTTHLGKPAIEMVFYDITERKQVEASLRKNEEQLRAMFEYANDAIFLFSLSEDGMPSNYLETNRVARKLLGYTKEEFLSLSPRTLTPLERRDKIPMVMKEILERGNLTFEGAYIAKNGQHIPFEFSACVLNIGDRQAILSFGRDITERQRVEHLMKQMAYYDYLTQLPNRRLFENRLQEAMAKHNVGDGSIALMFLDLDNFKSINDSFGHSVGDWLLQEVAKRITTCVRHGDTVSRLSGDEFTILLPAISREVAIGIADGILTALQTPFQNAHGKMTVTPSIGLSFYESGGTDVTTFVKQADDAMYKAKQEGKNRYRIFDGT